METVNFNHQHSIIRHDARDNQLMQAFLADVEHRAYRMAYMATGNRDDALDIVQDAMMKLVQKYSDKEKSAWKPLFYRILESRIMDFHRRSTVRNRFRSWLNRKDDSESNEDALEQQADDMQVAPDFQLQDAQFMQALEATLSTLPVRQQQVFMLRIWEGLSITETAEAMQCSESSVKTHYARALDKLRSALEEYRT